MAAAAECAPRGWGDVGADGRWPAFALVCLGTWLQAADALVTVTILPSVGAQLGGYAYFGWAIAGFYTGCILAGATAGRLSQRLGLRTATVAAGLVYSAGCLMSALAPNIGLFLLGRLVQGVGAGWVSGLGFVIVGVVFPERHLVKVLAAISAMWGAATFVGPLVGGLFAEAGHWRGAFWAFAAQAAAFSLAAAWLLRRSGPQREAPGAPLAQVAVLAGAVVALAAAGLMHSAGGAAAVGAAGLALLWLALRIDARARVQLLPRRAGDLSTVVGQGYAALFALPAAAIGLSAFGPAILQTLRGLSPLQAGYVVAVEALGWTAAAMAASRAGPRWAGRLIVIGGALICACVAAFSVALVRAPLAAVVALAALQGAGFGLSWGFISQRILGALGEDERPIGSSALGAVFQAGTAAGAALSGAAANLAGFAGGLDAQAARAAGFWVFAASVPVAVAGAWAAWRLGSRPPP
jgi:MFS family permease